MPRLTQAEYLALVTRRLPNGGGPGCEPGAEHELHDAIASDCRRRGWFVVHARMDKSSTQTPGAPDFVVFASGGRTLAVECKTRAGKLSPEQLGCRMMLEKNGHDYRVVRSLSDWLKLTEETQ